MTPEPACTYHGDQEKVRGRDLLEVFRVSVSEPFDVNQSQHHGAWRDTCLPAGVKHMQTNKKHFPLWIYQVKHPAICTNLQHATAPTWTHVQRISCGAYGWGSARTCGRIQLQCLQVGNTRDQPTALSPPQSASCGGDKAHLSRDRKGHPKTRPGPGRSTVVFSLVSITSDVQGETVNTATLATGDNQTRHHRLWFISNGAVI